MNEFVLYNAPQSTCSQRVRFVLNAKGLAFEEHKLDLLSGDQLKPEYLKINPNGVVPALLHNGRPVLDSAVIIEYLDEVRGDVSPFTPRDPVDRARMRWMMRYIDEIPTPSLRVPSYNLAFLPSFQKMSKEEFIALANAKPLRKEFLLSMGQTGFPQKEMDQALDRLHRSVVRMNDWIGESGGPWLMGKNMTLADVAIMPVIVRMDDINLGTAWADKPAIAHWLHLIQTHPAFKTTYYPGSLLTEKYPHLAALKK
ncbi:Glutathione S-transferase [Georgfuchsia toluolica]|uniref:Glutathione S-transferase n=1 Tax=Georgfuchsia toluolica TaxID=424218 RepID=A0A916NGZ2_9PROT|nr:glutathione S-transferase family protein [Georgfuchsia toluolica]CAG4882759.1 Glutathione S-transferase [Georgfuchsia toluolica]